MMLSTILRESQRRLGRQAIVSHPFFASLGFRPSSLPGGAIFGSVGLIVASQTSFIERRREAVRGLACDSGLLDGEAVVLRKDGRSDFVALLTKRGGAEATLVAFDLLRVDGDDLRLRPLETRRESAGAARSRRGRNPVQRSARRRGRHRVRQSLRTRPRRHRVEAGGQLLSLRQKPQLAEGQEPELRQDVTAMPTIDLTDDELAAVTAAIRRAIEDDKFRHAPRLDPLR